MPTVTDNLIQFPTGQAGLVEYVQMNDCNAPPYFAGRKRLLSRIEDDYMTAWERYEAKLPQISGLTRVIYGVPGAGKSSFLNYLRYTWQQGAYTTLDAASCERPGPAPAMLYCEGGDLCLLQKIHEKLTALAAQNQSEDLLAQPSETKLFSDFWNAGEQDVARASLSAIMRLLRHTEWKRPVVIGIDEAQNLLGDRFSPEGHFIQMLHENHAEIPLIVLLAGLSNTKSRVSELGVARLSSGTTHPLNGLEEDEVAELKAGFCDHFEIGLGEYSSEFDALLQRTDGWPAHLHNCLQAFSAVYLEAQCEIESVDFTRVEQLSQEARMEYYDARRSNAMKDSLGLMGVLMAQLTGSQERGRRGHILDMIQRISYDNEDSPDSFMRLPHSMNVYDFFNNLIENGVLQELDDGKMVCPIPGLRQYLIEVFRQATGKSLANGTGNPLRCAPSQLH